MKPIKFHNEARSTSHGTVSSEGENENLVLHKKLIHSSGIIAKNYVGYGNNSVQAAIRCRRQFIASINSSQL